MRRFWFRLFLCRRRRVHMTFWNFNCLAIEILIAHDLKSSAKSFVSGVFRQKATKFFHVLYKLTFRQATQHEEEKRSTQEDVECMYSKFRRRFHDLFVMWQLHIVDEFDSIVAANHFNVKKITGTWCCAEQQRYLRSRHKKHEINWNVAAERNQVALESWLSAKVFNILDSFSTSFIHFSRLFIFLLHTT